MGRAAAGNSADPARLARMMDAKRRLIGVRAGLVQRPWLCAQAPPQAPHQPLHSSPLPGGCGGAQRAGGSQGGRQGGAGRRRAVRACVHAAETAPPCKRQPHNHAARARTAGTTPMQRPPRWRCRRRRERRQWRRAGPGTGRCKSFATPRRCVRMQPLGCTRNKTCQLHTPPSLCTRDAPHRARRRAVTGT